MSLFFLPVGTIVTANLLRPQKGLSFLGSTVVIAGNGEVSVPVVTCALSHKAGELIRGIPDLVSPGPPVMLVLQLLTPGGHLTASAFSWPIERAVRRDELVDNVIRDLLPCVAAAVENLKHQLALAAMTESANAPAPETRQ